MACSCSPDDRLRRVLMVRRLHPAVTMQSLLQTFGAFGSITGCKVFTHKSGRSAGCASVEFASHAAACSAYKELQGSQLNSKSIHLQWFDPTFAQSPGRPSAHNLELEMSPAADGASSILAGRSSCGNGFSLPATPQDRSSGQLSHANSLPFGLLSSSPHNTYCNGVAVVAAAAAAAAAHQQQLVQECQQQAAALLAPNSSHMQFTQQQHHPRPLPMYPHHPQHQLHRQVSAPISSGFGCPGLQVPPSPHLSTGGGFDVLTSPGPCMHGNSDPGSMAATVGNLAAAMAAAGMPTASHDSNYNLAALQHLAALQQHQLQQQLAALALQQISTSRQQSDSPLSPVLSSHGQQQSQQRAFALAAALHSQQQAQLLKQQLSGQLFSPASTKQQHQNANLQLARSMPATLGTSLDSCGSMCSQGQLTSGADETADTGNILQQQQQLQVSKDHAALGSAGVIQQISPFALNQQVPESSTRAATIAGGEDSDSSGSVIAAATEAQPVDADTVPMSMKSLQGSNNKAHHAKQQLFRDEHGIECVEHALFQYPHGSHRGYLSESGAHGADAAGVLAYGSSLQQDIVAMTAERLSRSAGVDDTSIAGMDMLGAALAASSPAAATACSSSYPLNPCWTGRDQALDVLTPDLLASLQQQRMSQPDTCGSPLLHSSSGAVAAAAALQRQQQLRVTNGMESQPQLLPALPPPQQQQHNMPFSMPTRSVDGVDLVSDSVGDWPMRPAHVRVRASASQVLVGGSSRQCGDAAGFRLSSPSLPGSYGSPRWGASSTPDAAAAAAAHAWQCAMLAGSNGSGNDVQVQATDSTSNLAARLTAMPASEVFKHKHKQQLQLELPDCDLVSAPLTSAQLSGPLESFDQLITTEVMPESPSAAALPSPLDVSTAMQQRTSDRLRLAFNKGGSNGTPGWDDWSSTMAALLSPMHVPNKASRQFMDCHIPTDHAVLQLQQEQQHLRQQDNRSVEGYMSNAAGALRAGRASTGLVNEPMVSQALHELQNAGAASAAGGDLACGAAPVRQQGSEVSFSELGKTRHGSLCLDAHPQLLPSGLQGSEEAAHAAALYRAGSGRCSGPNSQLKRGLLSEGGALYSSGSFTFQTPVLVHQQQSQLGGGSSCSDAMITQPFQMPAFFRTGHSSRASSQQLKHSQQSAGMSGGVASDNASPAPAAAVLLPSVAESTDQQQQESTESCGVESDQVIGAPAVQRHLQHSFSLPVKMEPAVVPADSPARTEKVQQQLPDEAPYGDVFRSLWEQQ